ncbi:hypothetical protein E2C01_020391 [Portunus trituberculatus]|uniref:Uncharacterized protein n=1 Tax=Portunus trituberculatus TaxID=210409 RepID=A0A5B7E316_PORTR|nr:hypothetical protein [Portunus trituberculatus]
MPGCLTKDLLPHEIQHRHVELSVPGSSWETWHWKAKERRRDSELHCPCWSISLTFLLRGAYNELRPRSTASASRLYLYYYGLVDHDAPSASHARYSKLLNDSERRVCRARPGQGSPRTCWDECTLRIFCKDPHNERRLARPPLPLASVSKKEETNKPRRVHGVSGNRGVNCRGGASCQCRLRLGGPGARVANTG